MKTRVSKKRSFHLLLSLLAVIACTHLLKPIESFAQTTTPSKLTLRNGSQPSESLIKALLDWKELEGQRVTITDVNISCFNDTCLLVAGGKGIRVQSNQFNRDVREQILRCSAFGCPVTITGVISKYGSNPILEPQNITFLEGTQYNSASSQTSIPNKIADGIYVNGSESGEATEVVFVEGDKYHTGGSYENRAISWKPISESGIKYVARGIIYYPNTANPYYCTKEVTGFNIYRPSVRRQPIGTCSADGWSWK